MEMDETMNKQPPFWRIQAFYADIYLQPGGGLFLGGVL